MGEVCCAPALRGSGRLHCAELAAGMDEAREHGVGERRLLFDRRKRACAEPTLVRLQIVLSKRERGARSYARSPVKPAAPGRLCQCRRVISAARRLHPAPNIASRRTARMTVGQPGAPLYPLSYARIPDLTLTGDEIIHSAPCGESRAFCPRAYPRRRRIAC